MSEAVLATPVRLPAGAHGHRGVGWWGLLCAIAAEAALFAYLLFAYYYSAIESGRDFIPGPLPELRLALPNTLVLLLSSASVWCAERSVHKARNGRALCWLIATLALGALFVSVQLLEWKSKPFSISSGSYGSLYFTITGFHMAHVVAGLVALVLAAIWCARGYFSVWRDVPIAIVATYWHFVDAVWLCVFFTIYVSPRLWAP